MKDTFKFLIKQNKTGYGKFFGQPLTTGNESFKVSNKNIHGGDSLVAKRLSRSSDMCSTLQLSRGEVFLEINLRVFYVVILFGFKAG